MKHLDRENHFAAALAGIPSSRRRELPVMILQGYFDDSGSDPKNPLFVLAGFISTAGEWGQFSDDWATTLASDPPVNRFKASDAYYQTGEFDGWPMPLVNQKVLALAEVIDRYVHFRVQAAIKREDFQNYIAGSGPGDVMDEPYFYLFYRLLTAVQSFPLLAEASWIETFFDEQGKLGTRVSAWWDALVEQYPDEFKRFERPLFRSDSRVVPLQAADMYAWHVHHHELARQFGVHKRDVWHVDKVLTKKVPINALITTAMAQKIGADLLVTRAAQSGAW